MKYHTTLSTIVTSLVVLACFALAVLFCVVSLGIDSPGYLIATQLLGEVEGTLPGSVEFSHIERNISRSITVYDIDIGQDGETLVHIDTLTVYQNPFSLVWSLLGGNGRVEVDIDGIDVDISTITDAQSGEGGGEGPTMSLEDVNALINSLEDRIASLSVYSFYGLSYSVNVEDFSLRIDQHLYFENLRMNLSLAEGLVLQNFAFNAPEIAVNLTDARLAASNLSLSLAHGRDYRLRLSLDSIDLGYQDLSLFFDNLAGSLDFASFEEIDLAHLPYSLSAGYTTFSYEDFSGASSRLSLIADGSGLDLVALNLTVDSPVVGAVIPRADLRFDVADESYALSLRTSSRIGVELPQLGLDASLAGLEGNLSLGSALTFDFEARQFMAEGLDGLTAGIYRSLSSQSITLSGQSNRATSYLELDSDLVAGSAIGFFDGTELSFNVSAIIEEGSASDVILTVDRLKFNALEEPLSASIRYNTDGFVGQVSYSNIIGVDFADGIMHLSASSLPLGDFQPLIEHYAPILVAYIDDETTLNGSIEARYSEDGPILDSASLLGSIAISNIPFNQYRFSLASSISASSGPERIAIDYFTLTTQWLRLSYAGYLDRSTMFPQGSLALELTDSGRGILGIDFTLDRENEYSFYAWIPQFENSYLSGAINWEREGLVSSTGELRSGNSHYPFDLELDFNEADFTLVSEGLDVAIDFSQYLDLSIDFTDFALPTLNLANTRHASLDGSFHYSFDLAAQSYFGRTENFTIHSMGFVASRPDVSFDLTIDNDEFRLANIRVVDAYEPLEGTAVLRFGPTSFAMTLGNDNERANVSVILSPGDYSGILTLDSFTTDRFGLANAAIDTTLIGRGESGDDFSFSGALTLQSTAQSSYPFALNGDIVINEGGVRSESIEYRTENLTLSARNLVYSTEAGILSSDLMMAYNKVNEDRIYPVEGRASFTLNFPSYQSIGDAVVSTIRELDSLALSAVITLEELSIDNMIKVSERTIGVGYSENLFSFTGDLLTGSFDPASGNIDISVLENAVGYGSVSGRLDTDDLYLELEGIHFNLAFINWLCPVPLVLFENEAWTYGDFVLYGSLQDSHLYGMASSHGFDMRIWWLEGAKIHVGDVQVSVVDNHATTSLTQAVVVDDDDGDLHMATAVCQAMLSNANILDWYDIELWVDEGESVFVRVPMYLQNVQIKGDVSGHFHLNSDIRHVNMDGELRIDNATLSIGMDPLPPWWGPSSFQVRNDYDVVLGSNCVFVLPLSEQPIVRAYFDEDCAFHFLYDTETLERGINGTLSFRSGEIYYFQKNFFITEGSIVFPPLGTDLTSMRMNFRARLRSYDSEGEKVDIFLVLNNASFDNINPTFESTPAMTTEEIMSILGASLLPSSAYEGNSLTSMAGLVTSGMDVLNRMGVINTSSYADIGSVVRDSLGIDIFSMRTSILENFLIDAVFANSLYSSSPLATYLDNTSIYIGKYLANNIYLQIMVYLQAVEAVSNNNSFLADDLSLDLEISMEWENPLGTFTFFTTPGNLTLHSIFDNIGISYSNTIYF